VGFLLLTLAVGGVALASSRASVDIAAGSLQLSGPAERGIAVVTSAGGAEDIRASLDDFTVIDARGTGAGWHVTIQASRLTTGGETRRTLPLGSLSVIQPSVVKVDESSSAVPAVCSGPYTIDVGTAIQLASAAPGEGMGSYRFTFSGPLTVKVHAGAFPGTYSSTITLLVVSGP
jgi:WxL domain surface cell wall-binding